MKWFLKKNDHYYCDDEGKIIGKVHIDTCGNYRALYEYAMLGTYIEEIFAKNAVEKAYNKSQ